MDSGASQAIFWTDGEIATLRRLYPAHGCTWRGWPDALPGRTRGAIASKASSLGVRRMPVGPDWGEDELRRLMGWIRGMASDLGRSPSECVMAATTLMTVWEEGSGRRRGRGGALADREMRELLDAVRGGAKVVALAGRYGVSARTVQRWIDDAQTREALGVL